MWLSYIVSNLFELGKKTVWVRVQKKRTWPHSWGLIQDLNLEDWWPRCKETCGKPTFQSIYNLSRCTVNEWFLTPQHVWLSPNFGLSSWLFTFCPLYVFCHVSWDHFRLWLALPCCTSGTWMVFPQCGFFHEFLNYLSRWTSFNTLSSWMVSP